MPTGVIEDLKEDSNGQNSTVDQQPLSGTEMRTQVPPGAPHDQDQPGDVTKKGVMTYKNGKRVDDGNQEALT